MNLSGKLRKKQGRTSKNLGAWPTQAPLGIVTARERVAVGTIV